MAPIEIDDFPSDRNLHLWLGFSSSLCLNSQMVDVFLIHMVGISIRHDEACFSVRGLMMSDFSGPLVSLMKYGDSTGSTSNSMGI